ncbi:putative ribonuclease H-like domain-containing protein, partial [Tanacetum coccineum]
MNYNPVVIRNQSNGSVGTKACDDAGKARMETIPANLLFSQNSKSSPVAGFKPSGEDEKKVTKEPEKEGGDSSNDQAKDDNINSTNNVNAVSSTVNAASIEDKVVDENIVYGCANDLNILELEDIVNLDDDEDVGAEDDMNNLDTFMPLPNGKRAIGTKWFFRNKKDERGIVIKNKAGLVTQGYTQEEGIDYDEVFAPVARIEAIMLFLAYDSFKDFVVYQMDVKSAFLYGKIEEEVYVCQPPGFEDPDFPDRVYKVEKALYGLHQAPRAWYETLSTYLLDNGFQRGKIDKTLSIRRDKMMHKKFQMSSMGELTFFLGLQVKQKEDGIFISQDKYLNEILNKFGFSDVKTARTPMETQKALLKDADVCACARFQVNPNVSHLHAVKMIFRYLKGASLDRKSTIGGYQFLMCRLISWQCKKETVVANSTTEAEYIAASNCCGQ